MECQDNQAWYIVSIDNKCPISIPPSSSSSDTNNKNKMGNKSSSMLQDVEIKQISEETGFSSAQIEKLYARFAHLDRSSCGSLNKFDLMSIPELAINPLCDRLIHLFFSDGNQEEERINFKQFTRVLATFRSTNSIPVPPTIHHGHSGDSNNTTNSIGRNATQFGGGGEGHHSQNKDTYWSRDSSQATRRMHDAANQVHGKRAINYDTFGMLLKSSSDWPRNKLLFVFKVYDADNDGRVSFNDLRKILKLMVGNYIEEVQLDKIATRAFVEADEDNDGYIGFHEFCKVFSDRDLNNKLRVKFFS